MIKSLNSNAEEFCDKTQKAQTEDLEKRLEESVNIENLLKSQMELIQESNSKTVQDLKAQMRNLKFDVKSFENLLIQKDQEIAELKQTQSQVLILTHEKKIVEDLLEKQKVESVRAQEQIIEDLEFLHQSKMRNLNSIIDNLYSRLAESPGVSLGGPLSKLLSKTPASQVCHVLRSIDELSACVDSVESPAVQTCLRSILILCEDLEGSNAGRAEKGSKVGKTEELAEKEVEGKPLATKHSRSYTFAPIENSPNGQTKENLPAIDQSKQYETIFTFSTAFQCEFCKGLVCKKKFYEHLVICMNSKPEKPYKSVENIKFDMSQDSQTFKEMTKLDLSKVEKMEEQISSLKVTLGKLKNQRDKAKINSDRLLNSLKETKLELAMAEELAGQKLMELKLEIKNLVNFLLVLRNHLSFPSTFSIEVDKIVENAAKLFGGRVGLKL